MKRFLGGIILSTVIFLMTSLNGYAQKRSLRVVGSADNNFKPLANAKVSLIQNGKEVRTVYTDQNGEFKLDLDLNSEYVIVVGKPGFLSKKIVFNTQVPDSVHIKKTVGFGMSLFSGCDGVNTSILKYPVDRIQYTPNKQDFVSDKSYAAKIHSKIEQLMSNIQQCKDDKFKKIVQQADQLYNSDQYQDSREKYEEALKIYPDDKYSRKRIDNINKKIGKDKELQQKYDLAVKEADQLYADGNYRKAKDKYNEALTYQPQNTYPSEKITEIDQKLQAQTEAEQNQQAQEQQYNDDINNANAAYSEKNYIAAKNFYQQALTINPDAQLPKQKINELDPLIAQQAREKQANKANDKAYAEAVATAQKALQANDLTTARQQFNKALNLKPDADLPQQKIDEIDQMIKQQQENKEKAQYANKQKQINDALDNGDAYFKQKNYEAAATAYQQALDINPNDSYAKQRLDRSKNLYQATVAEKQKNLDKAVKEEVKNADALVAAGSYQQAIDVYKQAILKKPDDPEIKNKLAQAQSNLAAQNQKQQDEEAQRKQYEQFLAQGNSQFNAKNYQQAKEFYNKALAIYPEQVAPRTKIQEIDAIISTQQKQKQYNDLIASADESLASKNYSLAKSAYQQALDIKPDDAYAKQKINEIDEQVKENARMAAQQRATDQQYKADIDQADQLFAQGKLNEAKTYYLQASTLKSDESYPQDQLAKINTQLAAQLNKENEQKLQDKKYNDLISQADALFAQKKMEEAKAQYQAALAVKPNETYPSSQVASINNILAQEKKEKQEKADLDKKYADIISKADKAYDSKDFETAKAAYNAALNLKPDDNYSKKRLDKIAAYEQMIAAENARKTTSTNASSTARPKQHEPLPELKFSSDQERDNYLNKLKMKYPVGVTLEVYKARNKVTYRYVVIRDGKANEFRKTVYSWGGVEYKLNGVLITSQYFDTQVKTHKGEYFKKIDF